jgi:diguanylate cyclase (GGDEF)-like protein/PAS domain S-box-containing protein
VDNKRGEHRWRRIGDWPMALKLVAHCAGIAAALAVGLTAMGYIQAAQGLSERAEAALSADALVVTTAIDDWNAHRLSSIQAIARLPAVWRLLASEPDPMRVEDEQTARESLSVLNAPGEDVESVVIAAANGEVVLSNRPQEIGSNVRLQEDFRVAVAGHRSSISGVSMSPSSDHQVIFHTAPILDTSGRILGAVRVRSSVAAIGRVVQLAEDRTGAGAMGTLLDENGLVVVDSLKPDWLLRPVAVLSPDSSARLAARGTWGDHAVPLPIGETDLRQAVGVRQPTLFDWRMDGTQFRSLARPLSETPWSYVAALPVETFDAPARDFLRNATVAAVIGLLLGSASVLLFARSVAGRLRRVAIAAQGLARGELDQHMDIRSRDELGQMAAAFQDMIRHQQRMATVATIIASGDLRTDVEPASDKDVLGQAFAAMLRNLRELVSQVTRSEERFRSLVQNASDATAILDADSRISYTSPASQRVWGHAADALDGTSFLDLLHPDDRGAAQAFLNEAIERPSTNMTTELRLFHADGTWRDFEVIANNLIGHVAVAGIVLTGRDITERKTFERQLQQMAFHDTLTGLPNRALLTDRLDRAVARADRLFRYVAVLFIDLDNFKLINDGLGHGAGDRLLVAFADRLRGCIRSGDTAARLGGDEFILLLEEVSGSEEATEMADRIAELLRAPISVGDREVIVTASIGVALSTPHHDRTGSVLRNADLALYRAKAAGKARWILFEASMERDALERLELETDLRQGLERNELRLVYQPIVSLADGDIVEVEALARWQHPTRGQISPAQFIPIAEESGLIEPLGLCVLEEACRQAFALQRLVPHDRPLVMSVNLSGRQFQDPGLLDQIRRILRETGLEPRALKLEITESVLMLDAESTAARMRALTEIGVRFAIDDFGTGYSSLSYLRRFPVDTLKIDRSFVEGLGADAQAVAIVRSIVALAKALNLSVTGEGIETRAQHAQLRELGCDRGQGYLFARPLVAADLVCVLAQSFPQLAEHGFGDMAAA